MHYFIVIDGLIKKRSLKHLFKLLKNMKKEYEFFNISNKSMERGMKEYQRNKNELYTTKINNGKKYLIRLEYEKKIQGTFGENIEEIKKVILQDISICNDINERDIFILIDFNIYNNREGDNLYIKTLKIESFIEQTKQILKEYLFQYDKVAVLILSDKYQIICPLMNLSDIDINNISKDLYYYKNITFIQQEEEEYDDIYLNDDIENDEGFTLGYNENITYNSQEDSSEITEEKEYIIIEKLFLNKKFAYLIFKK